MRETSTRYAFLSHLYIHFSWYSVELRTGYYSVTAKPNPTGWFHLTLVYHGEDRGMSLFYDGSLMGRDTAYYRFSSSRVPSNGPLVIGRLDTNYDGGYSSVAVDELTLLDN